MQWGMLPRLDCVVSGRSAYPPILAVIADMPAWQPGAIARNRYAIASGPEGHGNIIPRGESIGSGGSALS